MRKSYLAFTEDELKIVNRSLLHSYLTQFRQNTFCTYLEGSYRVTATRELNKNDIITKGFAVQLRAYLQPDEYNKIAPYPVIAEIIFPTHYVNSRQGFKKGDVVELGVTPQFASLLHISKIEQPDDDTIIRLTAVSLAQQIRPPHTGPFDLSPPTEINLHAEYPLFPETIPKVKIPAPNN
jgi:hypothetical protein